MGRSNVEKLPLAVSLEFAQRGPKGSLCDVYVCTLADYFAVLRGLPEKDAEYWFRGHSRLDYHFVPSALRYPTLKERNKALGLLAEFRRLAERKLSRPPDPDDDLKWLQLAQHHGLPTRLLDWTTNAAAALYFACRSNLDDHGLVGILNPVNLNRRADQKPAILDPQKDARVIRRYLKKTGQYRCNGRRTVAVAPIQNTDRIALQGGVFTLHGSRKNDLEDVGRSGEPTPLACLVIPKDKKKSLLSELDRIGMNEMTLFPELEHTCAYLKQKAGL